MLVVAIGATLALWSFLSRDPESAGRPKSEDPRTPPTGTPPSSRLTRFPAPSSANEPADRDFEVTTWLIAGSVTTTDGNPVQEGTLEFALADGEVRSAVTSRAGRFEFRLPRSPIHDAVVRIGHAALHVVEPPPAVPPADSTDAVEWNLLIPTPWLVTGQVLHAHTGEPAKRIRVDLQYEDASSRLRPVHAWSDRAGRIRLVAEDLTVGTLRVVPSLESGKDLNDEAERDDGLDPIAPVLAAVTVPEVESIWTLSEGRAPRHCYSVTPATWPGRWPTSLPRRVVMHDGNPLDVGTLMVDDAGTLAIRLVDARSRAPLGRETVAIQCPPLGIKVVTPETGPDGWTRIAFPPGTIDLRCEVFGAVPTLSPQRVTVGTEVTCEVVVSCEPRDQNGKHVVFVYRKWDDSAVAGALVEHGDAKSMSDSFGIALFDESTWASNAPFVVTMPITRNRRSLPPENIRLDFGVSWLLVEPEQFAHVVVQDAGARPIEHVDLTFAYGKKQVCPDWDRRRTLHLDRPDGRYELPLVNESDRVAGAIVRSGRTLIGWISPEQLESEGEPTIVLERIVERECRVETSGSAERVRVWATLQGAPAEALVLVADKEERTPGLGLPASDGWFKILVPERRGALFAQKRWLTEVARYDTLQDFPPAFPLRQ
jgi:hypothetical protein